MSSPWLFFFSFSCSNPPKFLSLSLKDARVLSQFYGELKISCSAACYHKPCGTQQDQKKKKNRSSWKKLQCPLRRYRWLLAVAPQPTLFLFFISWISARSIANSNLLVDSSWRTWICCLACFDPNASELDRQILGLLSPAGQLGPPGRRFAFAKDPFRVVTSGEFSSMPLAIIAMAASRRETCFLAFFILNRGWLRSDGLAGRPTN